MIGIFQSLFLSIFMGVALLIASAGFVFAAYGGDARTASLDGSSVYYEEAGKADAPALVFIHGWSCDGSFWKEQVPFFAKNYRVIVLDLPGFGKSAKPNVDYSMAHLAQGVKAVLAAAGVKNPVLVGHSMGYAVIRQFLMDNPGAVRGIVNVDGAYYRVPANPDTRNRWQKEMDEFLVDFTGPKREESVRLFIEDTFYGQTPEALRPGIRAVMTAAAPGPADSTMKAMGRMEQWEERSFDVPALAVYAQMSMLPEKHEAYLRTVFPALMYEEWPETGHYLMLERPERFNMLLETFLNSLK